MDWRTLKTFRNRRKPLGTFMINLVSISFQKFHLTPRSGMKLWFMTSALPAREFSLPRSLQRFIHHTIFSGLKVLQPSRTFMIWLYPMNSVTYGIIKKTILQYVSLEKLYPPYPWDRADRKQPRYKFPACWKQLHTPLLFSLLSFLRSPQRFLRRNVVLCLCVELEVHSTTRFFIRKLVEFLVLDFLKFFGKF